jgi:hypothetical protein
MECVFRKQEYGIELIDFINIYPTDNCISKSEPRVSEKEGGS